MPEHRNLLDFAYIIKVLGISLIRNGPDIWKAPGKHVMAVIVGASLIWNEQASNVARGCQSRRCKKHIGPDQVSLFDKLGTCTRRLFV